MEKSCGGSRKILGKRRQNLESRKGPFAANPYRPRKMSYSANISIYGRHVLQCTLARNDFFTTYAILSLTERQVVNVKPNQSQRETSAPPTQEQQCRGRKGWRGRLFMFSVWLGVRVMREGNQGCSLCILRDVAAPQVR
jgi:hypothetical protein